MKKILIVEDDADIRLQLLKVLKLEGFDSIGAENGHIGIRVAKDQLPDLIICDIMMPDVNGYDVLAELRVDSLTASIPFIFLTAKSESKDFRKGMTLGADDYLTKPFAIEELLAAVRLRLEKHAAISNAPSTHEEYENPFSLSPILPPELRNPLRMMVDVSASLSTPETLPEPEAISAMGKVLHDQSLRMRKLVENSLLYSELRFLKYEPHSRPLWQRNDFIDTESFVAFFANHEALEAQRQDDLILDLNDIGVRMSAKSLQKIVRELLNNAFKFSEPGSPVHVDTAMYREQFCLKITDRGAGMARKQLADIMSYVKSDPKTYGRHSSGSQLGLLIACFLTRLCGGELTVESVPKQGTTVTVLFKKDRKD